MSNDEALAILSVPAIEVLRGKDLDDLAAAAGFRRGFREGADPDTLYGLPLESDAAFRERVKLAMLNLALGLHLGEA